MDLTGNVVEQEGQSTAQLEYAPKAIEARWRQAWLTAGAFDTPGPQDGLTNTYVFVSPPFPTGSVHVGHVRSYTIADWYARFRRAAGDSVLFAVGFDAFGLPAELAAGKQDMTPQVWVDACCAGMRRDFEELGISFDWSRSYVTCDPDIYAWTQRLFVALYEAGLIYRRVGVLDWCDDCETAPALLQADGRCWRCGGVTQLRRRPQWYLRQSSYNEENFHNLKRLRAWNKAAVATQTTLLGCTAGAEIDGQVVGGEAITLFTPAPEHIQDAAFVAISPRHADLDEVTCGVLVDEEPERFANPKVIVGHGLTTAPVHITGLVVVVPGVPRALPLIVTSLVDARYGPTVVLGIPSVDDTDHSIVERLGEALTGSWGTQRAAAAQLRPAVRYRSGDIPISRKRAWGAPVPMVNCEKCGWLPVGEGDIPVTLVDRGAEPPDVDTDASSTGQCPECGADAKRDDETLDCHADGLWIYTVPAVPAEDRKRMMFDHPEIRRWLPVKQAVHGIDTGSFVLAERMVAKALRDIGWFAFLEDGEPHGPTLMHEMVTSEGRKISKHLANAPPLQQVLGEAGADAVRFAILYASSPTKALRWQDSLLRYAAAFLARLWQFAVPRFRQRQDLALTFDESTHMRRRLRGWCDTAAERVTANICGMTPHRATRNVILLFERVVDFEAKVMAESRQMCEDDQRAVVVALDLLVQLVAPIAPHIAEELWSVGGHSTLVCEAPWPVQGAVP